MEVEKTALEGVVIITPRIFPDERGYFYESYSQREFNRCVCPTPFVQDNQSSTRYGVLRGLHFQLPPFAQSKLVRAVVGEIADIAVDIRRGSPTFGQHVAVRLSAENHKQLFIPRGFAHGFITLSPQAVVQYKCDNFYHKESEGALAWNDPALGIDWILPPADIILSPKDMQHPLLQDAPQLFSYSHALY